MKRNMLCDIPNRNQPIIAPACNLRAVRTPGHIGHGARKTLPIADALTSGHIPDLHAAIFMRGIQSAAIRRKGKRAHGRHRSIERRALLVLFYVPDPERTVQLARRQIATIRTPHQPRKARGNGNAFLWRSTLHDSHNLTVLSQLALASVRPSGENASPRTGLLCPSSVWTGVGLSPGESAPAVSHRRIRASCPALTRNSPLGLQVTQNTGPVCSFRVWSNAPLATSHMRI